MSPKTRYVMRSIAVGVSSALASLQQALPGISGDELTAAAIAGAIFGFAYAGIGAATPLEPAVGAFKN